MQALAKSSKLIQLATRSALNASVKSTAVASTQSMAFSTFVDKEKTEESRYIRAEEARRQAELKKKLEAILAQEDGSAQKTQVIQMLEHKPEEEKKGFLARNNLNNLVFGLPVATAALVPLISKGILVFNEETYVLIAFGLFVATVYTQGGPMIRKEFDAMTDEIRQSIHRVDSNLKRRIMNDAEEVEDLIAVDQIYAEIYELVDNLNVAQAQGLNGSIEHKYRDLIAKKLDSLIALESSAVSALRTRALSEVKANVLSTYKNDKKVKEIALNQALAVLAGGPNTKNGKDVVGETFVAAVKSYRENYAKQPAGSDKIIANLEKDIAALLSEPVLEEKGGNVYVTHRVSTRFA